jgi:hypothetical protein
MGHDQHLVMIAFQDNKKSCTMNDLNRDRKNLNASAPDSCGHIFIAGTGRSGTSYLVRYLTELGMDTHVSQRGTNAGWNEAANAGLEDLGLPTMSGSLPRVVKSPMLHQYIGELIESKAVKIDVVIIPIRDLVDAATSRSVVELRAIHEAAPWMTTLSKTWEHWGHTPGGSIFSLNPMDQARLLAVGFHVLIEHLVRADIPILFLEFPRFAEDGAYLFEKLRPWLPSSVEEEQALAAHSRTADAKKIRVRHSAASAMTQSSPQNSSPQPIIGYEGLAALDEQAIRRELERLRVVETEHRERSRVVETEYREQLRVETGERERLKAAKIDYRERLHAAEAQLESIYSSKSWKLTRGLRAFASTFRGLNSRK